MYILVNIQLGKMFLVTPPPPPFSPGLDYMFFYKFLVSCDEKLAVTGFQGFPNNDT